MAVWYMERWGVPSSSIWLKYGNLDPQYDPDSVTVVANEASSIYFITLVIISLFNLLATCTRRLSLFQQPPIFSKVTKNLLLFPAIIFTIVIVFIFCYVPDFQKSIATTQVPAEHWLLPAALGLGLLALSEARKYAIKAWPRDYLLGSPGDCPCRQSSQLPDWADSCRLHLGQKCLQDAAEGPRER
ncbi:uncharacterized protein BDR25DRAFT_309975 [Lindgomyces ingoldianus]|uniref:Uncharacterized protein n=1 Tax=Lindgomyces ingoldianus TaxID=673940 RepID=A0ACB6RBD2_9PLEO|nr:uncharacterized protein BDR25DRAFT_309975 [Lindgomyces ingoldianus]KAF2476614.1 hypothetical protein BDR25DRAFT_309975 [Lindgomyces ingoldianus]